MITTDKKLHVAHLVNYLGPAGKERGIMKLIDNIDSERFDNTIVCVNAIREHAGMDYSRFRIINLDMPLGNNFQLPFVLKKLFKEEKFDIVHTRSWGTLLEGVMGAKLAGAPVVIHGEHGTFPEKWPHTLLQNMFWRWADQMVTVSAELGKRLSGSTGFPFERMQHLLNGVDDSLFFTDDKLRFEFRQRFNFEEDDFVVGTIGRFYPVKNHPMLYRAAKRLKDRGEKIKLAIVGGTTSPLWQKQVEDLIAELDIGDVVNLLGFHQEVNMMLNGMDIFALTSFSEGCSNVIQEAIFAGVPVIATEVGGNPELVQHNKTGMLVPSDDDEALADRILELKNDSARRFELRDKALENARENFSLRSMIERYENLYISTYSKKFPNSEKIKTIKAVNV
ncbi:MAG: glycosyltransferase [Calditrichia bacterium]